MNHTFEISLKNNFLNEIERARKLYTPIRVLKYHKRKVTLCFDVITFYHFVKFVFILSVLIERKFFPHGIIARIILFELLFRRTH